MIKETNKFREILERLNFGIKRRMFEYSEAISPPLLNYMRLHELKKILFHAERNTKYWHNTLLSSGIDSQNLTLAAFSKLPLTTRSLMKGLGNSQFIASGVPENRRLPAYTSGSTGQPFVFYQDTEELIKRRLNVLYGLRLHGVRLWRPALISGLDTQVYLEPLGYKWSDLRNKRHRFSILYPILEQLKPEVLFCTPSYLKMFYSYLKEDGKIFSFKMIYCAGESMREKDRKIFSLAFHSKLSMWYATRETGPIAVECAAEKYHILPWSNYVEIVNSDGISVNKGEEGDIVVTSFYNFVMPFIRYKIGDRGTILTTPCICGNSIPVLKFAGRESIIVKIPGGNMFSINRLEGVIASKFAAAILQFQFVEKRPGEYVFRFVPSGRYAPEFDALLLKMLYEITGHGPNITLEKVQVILPNASGKTPVFLKNENSNITNE